MTEQHILVSIYSHNQQFVWHGYMARRNPKKTDFDNDVQGMAANLTELIEQNDSRPFPMILATKINTSTGNKIQKWIARDRELPNPIPVPPTDPEPMRKYTDKVTDIFVAVFLTSADNPENEWLMGLH